MTRKLYWETPYEKEFTATVISIQNEGIILDKTLFYPYGGNQLSDHGVIKDDDVIYDVKKVTKQDDEIIHHLSPEFINEFKVGKIITGKIDWEYRYGLMKSHTSQHIFSAVIKNNYDIDTVRANINFEEVTLSFSQTLSQEQLRSALREINELFTAKNLKINGKVISNEKIGKYKDKIRGNIPNEDQVRIVEINDLDMVCCGGTHVENSTEIGIIVIHDIKKGKELKYYIGASTLKTLTVLNIDLLDMANLLNTPINKVREKTKKNDDLILDLRNKTKTLELKLLELTAQNPIESINDVSIFYLEHDIEYKTISKNLNIFPLETFLVIKISPKKFRFISKIHVVNAINIMKVFVKKYGGKGGGNPSSAQVTFDMAPKDIVSDLKEILK